MAFKKAEKKDGKLRVAVVGPAGSGKTFSSLVIAKLLGCKNVGVIDSERGSSEKYSDKFDFSVDSPAEYSLRTYITKVEEAAKAGFDCLILDSMSHSWSGRGGALEQVDSMGGNKFANGWKTVTPLYQKLIDLLLTYPGHVICTMRAKTEYVIEQNDKGQAVPKRVGLKPVQRDDIEYEFDYVLMLSQGGNVSVVKQRDCQELEGFEGQRKDIPLIVEKMKKLVG